MSAEECEDAETPLVKSRGLSTACPAALPPGHSAQDDKRGGRGLSGHLRLVCSVDELGRTYLREQSFCAPVHLSKPHLEEDVLVVNVVNPTAGLLAGDRVHYDVTVESGARVLLTAPSASRAHRIVEGDARVTQEFRVASGGWLESWPEMFIPQGGARYRQRTTVRVEEGGEALLIEMIAPGRTASGEVFAFTELDWETEIFLGTGKIARERYVLTPESPTLAAMRAPFPEAYYASCFVISPHLRTDAKCWQQIHDLHAEDAWVGCSALVKGGWAIRVVAAGSVALRRTVAAIRAEVYAALGKQAPGLRRN
ncbi:Urease accessory protein UreD [Chthoniobacter flavus Ellin428]|uniref:Urease accessory protein UreD n=1 Tax=Chthoniobacter flavus Ellin428 TaxID=497964 RepID=B4D6T0_9BACT|nr:Urease accessory protein UreD [Chthoniobacter flavus Ellin428]